MWRAWWRGGACGEFSAGPRGLSVLCHFTLVLLFFLQWNLAIKLLCNDVDVVLVYLVQVMFCFVVM